MRVGTVGKRELPTVKRLVEDVTDKSVDREGLACFRTMEQTVRFVVKHETCKVHD